MNDKIRRYVIPSVPYLLVLWFCPRLGTAYRPAAGADFGNKLVGMIKTVSPAFVSLAPGFVLSDRLIGLAGVVMLRLVVRYKMKNARKSRRDVEYGSARWGTAKDIKPFIDPKSSNNVILTGTEFLTMNTRPANPANARNLNCCIIGSSGGGKTRFWLTPQLLQTRSSYMVVDLEGGILEQVDSLLKRQGYKIKVFNSIDFARSMHYNLLVYLKMESDILRLVNALTENTKGDGKEGDPFWTKAETSLYCALIGYIVLEGPEEERHVSALVDMLNSMETREDDENFKNAADYMFLGSEKCNPNHFAVCQHKKFKLASGKTSKSILTSCRTRPAPSDIEQLRGIMSYDEMRPDRMGDKKTAALFIISDTNMTYNFVAALAFSQMFNLLCGRVDSKYGGRLPHHVRVLWGEVTNTGQVPQLEKLVAAIHSHETSLCLLLQAQSQLRALYKDHVETTMGSMDSVIFLGSREHSTIRELSEVLGKETISMQTESRTRGQLESYGQNLQRFGEELMTTDELTTMLGDKCILQLRGLRLFLSPKYDLKQHPNYRYTAETDKHNALDASKLVNRRMKKLNPNEQYTVYEVSADEETAVIDKNENVLNYDDVDDPEAFAQLRANLSRSDSRRRWRFFCTRK